MEALGLRNTTWLGSEASGYCSIFASPWMVHNELARSIGTEVVCIDEIPKLPWEFEEEVKSVEVIVEECGPGIYQQLFRVKWYDAQMLNG